MKSGLILENNDVKKIIAEHFNVDESCVVKSQYTWTVVTGETDSKKEAHAGRIRRVDRKRSKWELICQLLIETLHNMKIGLLKLKKRKEILKIGLLI